MTKNTDEATTSTVTPPRVVTQIDRRNWIPGEIGIWVFIFVDLTVFVLLFALFMHERSNQSLIFNQSRDTLNISFGAINTLLLLSSSLFMALGVKSVRKRRAIAAQNLFTCTFLSGLGFAFVKLLEWSQKIEAGHTPSENKFYQLFYILTGFHFVHVLIGICVIIFLWIMARRKRFAHKHVRATESGASYWHMVDLLWIVLFGLFYLMQ